MTYPNIRYTRYILRHFDFQSSLSGSTSFSFPWNTVDIKTDYFVDIQNLSLFQQDIIAESNTEFETKVELTH